MFNFDPHPGHALSIAPGKRVFTSMAPTIVLREDGFSTRSGYRRALRIFPSAMQTLVNLIDHRLTLQQAVEAPRMFTQGHVLELETALFERLAPGHAARGYEVRGKWRASLAALNAIAFSPTGTLEGAACWRAHGTPVGITGGLARAGIRFTILQTSHPEFLSSNRLAGNRRASARAVAAAEDGDNPCQQPRRAASAGARR